MVIDMPIVLLALPFMILLMLCLIFYVERKNLYGSVMLLIISLIILWITSSVTQPARVFKTFETQVSLVDGASVIAYRDYYDDFRIVNLNDVFKKNVPPDSRIKVTIFQRTYDGLMYDEHMIPDKYEVLTCGD